MLLVLWSQHPAIKVYSALSPVLRTVPNLATTVVSDYSVPPGATAILGLGNHAREFLQSQGIVNKGRVITSLRGVQRAYQGVPLLLSYSEQVAEVNHSYFIHLLTDVGAAIRLATTGSIKPQYGAYRYVPDFSEMILRVEELFHTFHRPIDCTLDLETVGLDPLCEPSLGHPGAYIVSAQLACEVGKADVVYFESREDEIQRLACGKVGEQLDWWMNTPMIRLKGANLKYDLNWLARRALLCCTNFTFDTTLVGSLLDENRPNGLDVHTKIYSPAMAGYSDEFDKSVNKSRMDLVPKETLLPYAGGDVDADLRVAREMKKELLADPELTAFYVNILHPASRAFEQIEQGGVLLDLEAMQQLKSDLEQELDATAWEARVMIGGHLIAKHLDALRPGQVNLTKPSLLMDYMFSPRGLNLKPFPDMLTKKTKKPSTSLEHMMMFDQHPKAGPFVKLIKDFSSASKILNTYVIGFLDDVRSDKRLHPTYWLFAGDKAQGDGGTNTGRLSAKNPPFQTLIKHGKWAEQIRNCYPAPPGFVVVERDYSSGELRVVADVANETNMLAAFAAGQDLHVKTAAPFAGYTYDSLMALEATDPHLFAETRQLGKAGNFGLVYGMGEEGFMAYAFSTYGVVLTRAEVHDFRESYFSTYAQLLVYHREYKKHAHKFGYVRGPLGRLRHLPLINSPQREVMARAERQSLNSPIQMTLSDMLIWTLAIEHAEGLTKIAPSFGACHDAAYSYVPEGRVDELVPQMLDIMENLPFHKVGWEPKLKFLADAKFGPTMGSLQRFHRKKVV